MSPVHGLILGFVQGLTEFLPVSSSAHLILVPWLWGWPPHSLTFDVALHMGTLAALLAYFGRDWWELVMAWLPPGAMADIRRRLTFGQRERANPSPRSRAGAGQPRQEVIWTPDTGIGAGSARGSARGEHVEDAQAVVAQLGMNREVRRRLGISLVVATIPGALIGASTASRLEESLRSPILIAMLMVVAAIVLAAADRAGAQELEVEDVGLPQAAMVGVAQALALAPGVSRSGITIAAALFLGLTRPAAARFAFLLAAPITAGAGLFQLRHLVRGGLPADERAAFAIGIVASFAVGMLAIGGLLRYLRTRSLDVFVGYRLPAAMVVLLVAGLGWR